MNLTLKRTWIFSITIAFVAAISIFSISPAISDIEFAPDQGFNWYFWKRPDPTFWSRISVWVSYLTHQLFIWGVIGWAQANRTKLRDRNKMHPINWIALVGTALFVALHYLQTAVFYDGLGQDLPVITSQGSVIILLVIVLLMEAPRRGLFLGVGTSWFSRIRPILLRYHGYYFAWAVTFTYWYHPMETTLGHVLGFMYTFLLLIQGAFIFTRVHSNKYWTFVLEGSVLVHGVIVAFVAGQEILPMFLFGFLFLIVMTQMHGLGLSRSLRWAIGLASIFMVLIVYSSRGWENLNEVLRIPIIDYILVFAFGGLLLLGQKLFGRGIP